MPFAFELQEKLKYQDVLSYREFFVGDTRIYLVHPSLPALARGPSLPTFFIKLLSDLGPLVRHLILSFSDRGRILLRHLRQYICFSLSPWHLCTHNILGEKPSLFALLTFSIWNKLADWLPVFFGKVLNKFFVLNRGRQNKVLKKQSFVWLPLLLGSTNFLAIRNIT